VAVVLGAALAACGSSGIDVNQVDNAPQPDGGGSTVTNPPPTGYTDPFAGAGAYSGPGGGGGGGDGSHNAGQDCMQSHCHGGGHENAFLLGGTVYQDYAGTIAAVGVEIRVVDTAGHAQSVYSDRNGNFHISANGATVSLPANVGARNATVTRPMITQLSTSMGGCSQSGCHTSPGGSPSKGNYYPIHVP
jgi:hypothetical protein